MACAARIGGISYFHRYAYDLIAENERIIAATFDAAIEAHRKGKLRKISVLSSSMVFENATVFPTPESHLGMPAADEHLRLSEAGLRIFCRGAWQQHRLPYTILRPFNCVGTGERRALGDADIPSGNVKLAMSHVVPDLVQKVLKGQDPLHILGNGNQSAAIPMAAICRGALWPLCSIRPPKTKTSISPRNMPPRFWNCPE